MVLGTYHMANPKADLIKTDLDDHLGAKRQKEIEEAVEALSKFAPTTVMVERGQEDGANELYHDFLRDQYTLTANEVDQLGMRLARKAGLTDIHSIDVPGEMDFDPVFAFAERTHDAAFFDFFESMKAEFEQTLNGLRDHTVAENLAMMNSPAQLHLALRVYVRLLRLNDGRDYPGADLVAGWYARNLRIFGNLARLVRAGDRALVLYGQGHAPILRQLVLDSGDMELVEPGEFL